VRAASVTTSATGKPRVLVFIVAYYAEKTILSVLERIPVLPDYETEVLVIDDGSKDRTFELADQLAQSGNYKYRLTVLRNPDNQGYGGNQKIGYHYALQNNFDAVALVHGDGQYAPELLPELLKPILDGEADAVHGSRMLTPGGARRGGMPLYKRIGNRILTKFQNIALGSELSEFHTGYKLYSVAALRRIPFELNSNVFHFDTEIIIQLFRAGLRVVERPIPTHYGDEICRVNGVKYAKDVILASIVSRMMNYGLLYRRNFDVQSVVESNAHYLGKLAFKSTHSEAIADVKPGSVVIDLGCGPGHLTGPLKAKGCKVIGIDQFPPAAESSFDEFHVADLNGDAFPRTLEGVDQILLLDIIEHLSSPEAFCDKLREACQRNLKVRIVLSTGNIAFCVTRLMLFLGQFNYSKKGILDLTHTRLFTFSSMRRLLNETGFEIEKEIGIPSPAPIVLRNRTLARFAMWTQGILIRLSKGLFSYQIYLIARPKPTLPTLLAAAHKRQSPAACEVAV